MQFYLPCWYAMPTSHSIRFSDHSVWASHFAHSPLRPLHVRALPRFDAVYPPPLVYISLSQYALATLKLRPIFSQEGLLGRGEGLKEGSCCRSRGWEELLRDAWRCTRGRGGMGSNGDCRRDCRKRFAISHSGGISRPSSSVPHGISSISYSAFCLLPGCREKALLH